MSLTHTWAVTVKDSAGTAMVVDALVITGDVDVKINEVVAAGAVKEIDVAVTASLIQSFFMESTLGSVVVKLNSTTTPASPSPLTMTAKQAYGWKNTDPGTNPLTVNLTKIYIDNSANSTKSTTFTAAFLSNLGV
jgi:hypothetical protein